MSIPEQSIYNEVFISYSRKNVEFARKLVDAIYADGRKNVWIDWEDIEYAEDWWQKIQLGIDSAENFIFVITPDSLQSRVCFDEVNYAEKSGKRIIPLLYQEIIEKEDFEKMHPAISQHNWLPFTNEDDFDAGIRELFRTLDTDLAHVRYHTRLLTRAREWDNAGRNEAYLLSTGELDEANEWLSNLVLKDKEPHATDLQREYVRISQVAVDEHRERERKLEERARRNRLYLGAAIPSIIGLIIASFLAVQAFYQRQDAVRQARDNESISNATLASFYGRTGENPLIGLSYAYEANRIENPPLESQIRLAELVGQPGAVRRLLGHLGEVWSVEYSPDGETIYTGAGSFTGADDDRMLQWDISTGEIVREYDENTDRVYSIAASPDGRFVATGSQDARVLVWDAMSGELIHSLGQGIDEHESPIFSIKFTHDSTRLISGAVDRMIVWDMETGSILKRVERLHGDHVLDFDISEDDRRVFSGGFDGSIRLWNLETGEVLRTLEAGQVTGARFLPDETRAVTADLDGNITFWDLQTAEMDRQIVYNTSPLRGGVVVTPDGDRVVSADSIGNVLVWEVDSLSDVPLVAFAGHDNRINTIALHPNGQEVATASLDYTTILWDIYGRDAEAQRYGDTRDATSVYSADTNRQGTQVAIGLVDGRVQVFDKRSGDAITSIVASDGVIYRVRFHPNGDVIAVASEDTTVSLWNADTGELVDQYTDLTAPVRVVAFNGEGTLLAAAGGQVQVSEDRPEDNRIIIWNQDGEIVHSLDGHDAAVRDLVFSPDGAWLVSAGDDGRIIRWNVETGDQVNSYEGHSDSVWSLSYNRDGTQILSGSRDTTVIRWDAASGDILSTFEQHTTGIRAVAFHPDGIHAVTGAGALDVTASITDYDLLFWNLASGDVIRRIPGHRGIIRSLVFANFAREASSNGDVTAGEFLSAGDDGAVILWYADDLERLLQRVEEKYQIVCLLNDDGCEDRTLASLVALDDDTIEGFPLQMDDAVRYAPDSECMLPDNEQAPPSAPVDTAPFESAEQYVIGYSHGNVDNTSDGWILAWAQYQADQSDLVERIFLRDAQGRANQQINDLQLLVDADVDAIIINPIEQPDMDEMEQKIAEIVAEGIPVILVGNRTEAPVYTTYVGYDPYEIGCLMAQELAAHLDGEGSIGVVNGVDVSVADAAYKAGEEAVFDLYGSIALTVEGPTDYDPANAFTLTERDSASGFIGYTSDIMLAAQRGVRQQGLDYVPFASGHSVELAQFVLENELEASLIRRSTQMGAVAIETAVAILQGADVTSYVRQVPEVIMLEDIDASALAVAPTGAYLGDWEDLPEEYYPE